MTLLVVPGSLTLVMTVLGLAALIVLGVIIRQLFIKPVRLARADIHSPPPEVGLTHTIVIDGPRRSQTITIGCLDSDIKTRLNGIKEDHLTIRLEKERDLEDYHITIIPGGPVFYRHPHSRLIETMKGPETFESRELIGHVAQMRIAANVRDQRPTQYVEFELSSRYFINQYGEEKMRFSLVLNRIFPGLDINSRTKKGVFMFGRLKVDQESDEQSE